MPLFHVGGIGYSLFGIRAGVPTIMTREPDAASVIGAAPMPLPLLHRALSTWPDTKFVQVYGQTELCGAVTALGDADHRDAALPGLQLSAGKAVLGTEIRIVDPETGARLTPGEPGEIWVRSNQNMSGYLNRSEATAETITVDDWVRTGDVGRLDADDYVYVEDRLKDMIITGSENVYGPEVESVLIEHPDIDEGDVIEFCRRHMAGYKCPRTVDFVPSLPRNPSGKSSKPICANPIGETGSVEYDRARGRAATRLRDQCAGRPDYGRGHRRPQDRDGPDLRSPWRAHLPEEDQRSRGERRYARSGGRRLDQPRRAPRQSG